MNVTCPACLNAAAVPDNATGKRARCPHCLQPFTVAAPLPPAPTIAAAPVQPPARTGQPFWYVKGSPVPVLAACGVAVVFALTVCIIVAVSLALLKPSEPEKVKPAQEAKLAPKDAPQEKEPEPKQPEKNQSPALDPAKFTPAEKAFYKQLRAFYLRVRIICELVKDGTTQVQLRRSMLDAESAFASVPKPSKGEKQKIVVHLVSTAINGSFGVIEDGLDLFTITTRQREDSIAKAYWILYQKDAANVLALTELADAYTDGRCTPNDLVRGYQTYMRSNREAIEGFNKSVPKKYRRKVPEK